MLFRSDAVAVGNDDSVLFSYEECLKEKRKQALNFKVFEEESNKYQSVSRLIQRSGAETVVVNPPCPVMSESEIDAVYDLPFTRLPHPKYKDKTITAFDMIRFSVNIHRGCFGGCSFCTISAHQGKRIVSRSKESILKEVAQVAEMPDFKGYISDLGGPSANMYKMGGRDVEQCQACKRASCLFPKICANLNADHRFALDIYREADKLPGIKKTFVGSGVRYDMLLHDYRNDVLNRAAQTYTGELIRNHVSGRLKVAPEHTSPLVLKAMRKPPFDCFEEFNRLFHQIDKKHNLRQQLIPYFISGHPGCSDTDMAELAIRTKKLNFKLEQVQEFTPTPMTLAAEMFYTGLNPYTMEKVYSAKGRDQKMVQRAFFFWYDPEQRRLIVNRLNQLRRPDLINKLFGSSK